MEKFLAVYTRNVGNGILLHI